MKGALQVFVRFLLERGLTGWTAKIIRFILIDKTGRRFLRVHRHFTNRVDSDQRFGSPETRLYDTRYHRRERLFCDEPSGEQCCYKEAESETGKAEEDCSGRFANGQSQIGC